MKNFKIETAGFKIASKKNKKYHSVDQTCSLQITAKPWVIIYGS